MGVRERIDSGSSELVGQGEDLPLVEARDRLHVGQTVASLDEEALVVLEQVRRADHRVGEPVGPGVLEQLADPLLHVRGGEQRQVGGRGHPAALLRAVGALDDEREDRDPAAGGRAHQLVLPVRLVLGEDLADRLVALAVAPEALERVRDRHLDAAHPEVLRQLGAEVRGAVADVALGQAQAEHLLRAERPHADPRGDAGVDSAGDRDDRAAPAQRADRLGRALGQLAQAGGGVEVLERTHLRTHITGSGRAGCGASTARHRAASRSTIRAPPPGPSHAWCQARRAPPCRRTIGRTRARPRSRRCARG